MAQNGNIKIFIAYSREDQHILNRLRTNLRVLERTQNIKVWYDGEIEIGSDWQKQIKNNLHSADIILLLISENFIASDYCYDTEMMEALSLHDQNKVRTIPIIAKECLWQRMPFARLQALPEDGKPIMANDWDTPNRPYLQIAKELEKIVLDIRGKQKQAVQNLHQRQQRNAQKQKFEALLQKGNDHFQRAEWQQASSQFQNAISIYEASFGGSLQQLQQQIQSCNREMGYDSAFREANLSYAKGNYKNAIQHIQTALQLKTTTEANQLLADAKNQQKHIRQTQIDDIKKNKLLRFGLPILLLIVLGVWGISNLGGGDSLAVDTPSITLDNTSTPNGSNKVQEESIPNKNSIEEETLPSPTEIAKKEYQELVNEGDRYLRKSEYQNAKSKYQSALDVADGFKFSKRDANDGLKKCENELEKIRQQKLATERKRNEAAKKKSSKSQLPQVIIDFENNMEKIPSGTFIMGCKEERDKKCYDDEKPTHQVHINSFYMNKYEVTQEVWQAVMGDIQVILKIVIDVLWSKSVGIISKSS